MLARLSTSFVRAAQFNAVRQPVFKMMALQHQNMLPFVMGSQYRHFSSGASDFKVKIVRNNIVTDLDALKQVLPPVKPQDLKTKSSFDEPVAVVPDCFFPKLYTKAVGKESTAMNKTCRHSAYKLAMVAKVISGRHLYDAQNSLSHIHKKASLIIAQILNAARKNGV